MNAGSILRGKKQAPGKSSQFSSCGRLSIRNHPLRDGRGGLLRREDEQVREPASSMDSVEKIAPVVTKGHPDFCHQRTKQYCLWLSSEDP
jgi:hypothetical protein